MHDQISTKEGKYVTDNVAGIKKKKKIERTILWQLKTHKIDIDNEHDDI